MITLSINTANAISGIQNWQRKLNPALAKALNSTARQAQQGTRRAVACARARVAAHATNIARSVSKFARIVCVVSRRQGAC